MALGGVSPMDNIRAKLHLQRRDFTFDLDLTLPGQGVIALFGPSGSGKTTCLRWLAGLEPAPGFLSVNGDVWQDSQKRHFIAPHQRPIGYVFQEASLFAHLSVRDNLLYGLKRVAVAQRRIELEHAVNLLGIEHLFGRHIDALSGGERQRIGIARALLTSPQLLLMDEPLAALDAPRKAEILPYLERLHRELRIPVVYVSHAQDEVARLADHIVLLDQGRVLASAATHEILARTDLPLAFSDDAGTIIDTQVAAFDAEYSLLSLQVPGSEHRLRLARAALPIGQPLRVKIQARDVSLSLHPHADTSILNILPASVLEITRDIANPAQCVLRVAMDGHVVLVRMTWFSVKHMALRVGQAVWMQIKSVAVLG